MFIFALIMIFTVNTKLALAMVLVLPFTAFTTYLQSKEVHPAFKRNRDCFSSLNAFVQENVSGNRVVRAFSKEDYEMEKFGVENDKFRAAQVDASKIWMKYVPVFEVLSYVLNIILMFYGGYMVIWMGFLNQLKFKMSALSPDLTAITIVIDILRKENRS